MDKSIDTLCYGDEIEWEDCNGEVYQGTVKDILSDWEVYVEFFKGNFVDDAEVRLTQITKINGATL
jgi:hypothetical protein